MERLTEFVSEQHKTEASERERKRQKKQNDVFVFDYKAWDLHGNSARLRQTAGKWD